MVAPGSGRKASSRLSGVTVLVADDDIDAREIAAAALTAAGAEVETAASACHALDTLAAGNFSVLVCDIGMPEMDGYALLERVRAGVAGRSIYPCHLSHAHASEEDKARAIAAGFQAHVAKPFNVTTLVETVASVAPTPV
jgi:CheY-like chemotaxis protein